MKDHPKKKEPITKKNAKAPTAPAKVGPNTPKPSSLSRFSAFCKEFQAIIAFAVIVVSGLTAIWAYLSPRILTKASFGDLHSMNLNTEYPAESDGIVVAWAQLREGSPSNGNGLEGRISEMSSSEGQLVAIDALNSRAGLELASISFPVRRGEIWHVRLTGSGKDSAHVKIYWRPLLTVPKGA